MAAIVDARPILRAIGPHQRLRDDVIEIGLSRRTAAKPRTQIPLMWQDARLEPIDTTRLIDHASSPKTAEKSSPDYVVRRSTTSSLVHVQRITASLRKAVRRRSLQRQ